MSIQLNTQSLYETLRKTEYRGAIQTIVERTKTSRQWVNRVLSGKVTESQAVFKIIQTALVVKAEYDNQIAAKRAEIEKMNNAIAMATA